MLNLRAFFKRLQKQTGTSARDLTMRQVLAVRKTKVFPSWKQWKQLPTVLANGEKRLLMGASAVFILALLIGAGAYVTTHRVDVPAVGGEYTEGLVGEPQFINPLYSSGSDVDQDLVSLIYSGLLRWDPEKGFVPDLAESIEINEDGTAYTLKIRDNARFHNGDEVRARDVIFTINAIQNPSYRSPLADQFYNVNVVQEDDKTVSFILDKPYAPFLQSLTVGILPANLWAEILPQNAPLAALNQQPIGSGPYVFSEFAKDKRGSIKSYTLTRNENYYANKAHIQTLTFKFYPDASALADALSNKNVEGAGVVPFEELAEIRKNKNLELLEPFFPQEAVLYFNQETNDTLADQVVRHAIAGAIDKASIVEKVYGNSARVIHAQILPGMIGYDETIADSFDPNAARASLEEAGYLSNENNENEPINLTLTTLDRPDLKLVADGIQKDLAAIGINLTINLVSGELIDVQIVDPRDFELLLAPVILKADPDPYPFWHSSQAQKGGLNLVGYKNEEADTLIEKGRDEIEKKARAEIYKKFQSLLAHDMPAVFLYQFTYGYALSRKVRHPAINLMIIPSDRFAQVTNWYIKTKKILK